MRVDRADGVRTPGAVTRARPPLVVVEGSDELLTATLAELRAAGWAAAPGFVDSGRAHTPLVRYGVVTTATDAASALLAALAGCGLVIEARCASDVLDRLLQDLRHVGPVEQRRVLAPLVPASDDGRRLLRLLAAGLSLGEAAAELGLPRRTADRRLADVRRRLGVARTAEAVARARRLGWFS